MTVLRSLLVILIILLFEILSFTAENAWANKVDESVVPPTQQENPGQQPANSDVSLTPIGPSTPSGEEPPVESPPTSGAEPPAPALSPPGESPPIPPQQIMLQSQLDLLLIDDENAGNQYITTIGSSGMALPGSASAALFGVRNVIGRNQSQLTWYPHNMVEDIASFSSAEPEHLFRGLVNRSNQHIEGNIVAMTLPDVSYVNPLLSPQLFDILRGMGNGAGHTLTLSERLTNGDQRTIQATVIKQGQLSLRNPGRITCRNETVEGSEGRACLLRETAWNGNAIAAGDIQFIMRSRLNAPQTRYRIGQQWVPLNTPLPVSEFASGQGIELFFIPPTANEWESMRAQFNGQPLSTLLEAGFYSASRYSRGDLYGLNFSGGTMPSGESAQTLSRLEVLLIDDQAGNNSYVTTLNSSGSRGQSASLFGVRRPGDGERPGVWYAKQGEARLTGESSQQLTPAENFNGFVNQQGQPQGEPSFAPQLSDAAWQQLLAMSPGEAQQWRYEVTSAGIQQLMLSHIVKNAQLQLRRPGSFQCRPHTLAEVDGQICLLREVNWQGGTIAGDVRFVLRSKVNTPQARYRVGQQWKLLGDSVPISEFADSQGIELFFVPPNAEQVDGLRQQYQGQPLSSLVQMQFFSPVRLSRGDRFSPGVDGALLKQRIQQKQSMQPLQISSVQAVRDQVAPGEALQVEIQLNRGTANDPQQQEKLYLHLVAQGEPLERIINFSQVEISGQRVPLREQRWQAIEISANKQNRLLLTLPTWTNGRGGRLVMRLASENPEAPKVASRSEEQQSIQQLELRVQQRSTITDDQKVALFITKSVGGILGRMDGMIRVQVNRTLGPITEAQPLTITVIDNPSGPEVTPVSIAKGTVIYRPPNNNSLKEEVADPLNHTFTAPAGTTDFYIYLKRGYENAQQDSLNKQVTVQIKLGESLPVTHTVYLNGASDDSTSSKLYKQISKMEPESYIISRYDIVKYTIFINDLGKDTGNYRLRCRPAPDNNPDFSLIVPTDVTVLLGGKEVSLKMDENYSVAATSQDLGKAIQLSYKALGTTPNDVYATMQCRLDAAKGDHDFIPTGIWASDTVATRDRKYVDSKVAQLSGQAGAAHVDFMAVMDPPDRHNGSINGPGNAAYYRLYREKPGDITWPPGAQIQCVEGYTGKQLTAFCKLPEGRMIQNPLMPKISIDLPGITAKMPITLEISGKPSFPANEYTKKLTLNALPDNATYLTILESATGHIGGTLSFPVVLNQPPLEKEELWVSLIGKEGVLPSKELNLSQAQLRGKNSGISNRVDLTASGGGIFLPVYGLNDKELELIIPIFYPAQIPTQEKKVVLSAKMKGQQESIPDPVDGTIEAFEERLEIQTPDGLDFSGNIGDSVTTAKNRKLIRIIWEQNITRGLHGTGELSQKIQARAMRDPSNFDVAVTGTPWQGALPHNYGADGSAYCALDVSARNQPAKVPLPGYLLYQTKEGQVVEEPHGCRGQFYNLLQGNWLVVDTKEGKKKGTLELIMGFRYDDPASGWTNQNTNWMGQASTSGTIVIRPQW